ncbi:MAG: RNB domain-containing ribonuclease [Synechococcus sp. SB0666_bin_14]|nr:RNB domain-containing ribonuclease [Synechococcus sp. SB0666_bin_14]MYA90313.1 RNB domain-containing ribonuclease [Synechococcus sp. SB0663_bin_10]MYG47151.1 RNB domain-containing ribonuclease [Synechococcus sp. SB0675_bin_6]MYJ59144.1 RNB domain-containing ribonuclease [Synechococcus sp. SB0672_bin_6]MYK91660.1 RNB domain-containing ribonuclease [Synechococcus sp. SB0669_bin_8]
MRQVNRPRPAQRQPVRQQPVRGFPPALRDPLARLRSLASQPCPGDEDRQDLTGLASLSIDDAGTIEVDDALALEPRAAGGWRLWIHVADPTALLSVTNPLTMEACRRGCSAYLSHGAMPMFPESLAQGVFSLRPGQRCRALSFWVDLDEDDHAMAEGWTPSWVRLCTAVTYNDVDDLLSMAPPEEDNLLELHRITRQLNQGRRATGALCLEQPEARFRPMAGGSVALEVLEPTPARQLVAECMVLAGQIAGRYGQRHDLPLPYRGQTASPLPSPQELATLSPGAVRNGALKACLQRSSTGTRPQPHFALGAPVYVQVTSPIRRFTDFLAHLQLKAHCCRESVLTEPDLQHWLDQALAGAQEAGQRAKQDRLYWLQSWLQQERGPWAGCFVRWLRESEGLGLVWCEDMALELVCNCPSRSRPDDPLTVNLLDVNPERSLLRLKAQAV